MTASLTYKIGDATSPQGAGAKIIVHICNDIGGWGRGFVLALSRKWPQPEARYRAWHRGEVTEVPFELGQVQFVQVESTIWVANLIGQRDIRSRGKVPPVRYEAVREGLKRVAQKAASLKASVHMPHIGCGLAGGKWEEMEPIIREELTEEGVNVTVYDLAP